MLNQKVNISLLTAEEKWLQSIFNYRAAKENWQTAIDISRYNAEGLKLFTLNEADVISPDENYERLLVNIGLIPYFYPEIFTLLNTGEDFKDNLPNFFKTGSNANGGVAVPTLETFLFTVCGTDRAKRVELMQWFNIHHPLFTSGKLQLQVTDDAPLNSAQLIVSKSFLELMVEGYERPPLFSSSFPAKRITTHLTWNDLIIDDIVRTQVDDIIAWQMHSNTIMHGWGLKKIIKPGYRVLFYGPSGTGKTLTAMLMGAELGVDVYRVDLSMVVSKYIGETEKNLARLFDKAENKNWILFFDEADALFGSRTQVKDSHDRYANQEISYLLQRVEDYDGLVILASNIRGNIDQAFARRFQSMIEFKMPKPQQRKILWERAFSKNTVLNSTIDIENVAKRYEIAGGAIVNVVQYCSLKAAGRGSNIIELEDLVEGLKREFLKEGKTI